MARIICVSDTHSRHDALSVPDGDILIHAGDFTMAGRFDEIVKFNAWLGTLPHRHKIIIAGNHDLAFERAPGVARLLITNAVYLEDSLAEAEGLKIYGTPWQPKFKNWAFNLERGEAIRRKWALIPEGVDVLVTHGPPYFALDLTEDGQRVGCEELAEAVARLKPRLNVFGHVHEGYGTLERGGVRYVNASACDERYMPVNAPVVVDI